MEYVHPSRPRPPLPDDPFLVVGLARSGVAAAIALKGLGKAVHGVDAGHPDTARELDAAGIGYSLGTDGTELLEGISTVVKSPGVPEAAPVIAAAAAAGVQVVGELELGWRMLDAPFVAITGTNGKTTTTEMAAHLFRSADRPVAAAGNVGQPVTGLATAGLAEGTTVVCECSSFQLEDSIEFAPECAVYLNLAPDHLDRHTSMEAYSAAKLKIFENQVEGDVAIINAGPEGPGIDVAGGDAARLFFRAGDGLEERYDADLRDGMICVDGEPLMPESDLKVLGRHNVANAMAAALAAISMGLGREQVAAGLASFQGVAHRLEAVGEIEGVTWVNDSKATNVEAATVALGSFEEGVHLILGGSLKGESFDGLLEPVARCCKAVYLIGEATGELTAALSPATARGVRMLSCGDLDMAVLAARQAAEAGDVVLLSPACASFDQFENYEQRGDEFRSLVKELDGLS